MCCGRCCATEPHSRAALQLDIFIEILLWDSSPASRRARTRGPLLLLAPAPLPSLRPVRSEPIEHHHLPLL